MSMILILEDDPARTDIFRATLSDRHTVVAIDNAADFIKVLETTPAEIIFLDHDLGGQQFVSESEKNTGSEVVRYMTSNACRWAGSIIVHSMNPVAASAMEHDLRMAGYTKVYRIPFSKLTSNYLHDPGFIT